jgi:HAD superfamily hydrolase (TIGR01450 family)
MSVLVGGYDAVVCDLDGVVYRGAVAVPHAVESLAAVTVPVVYATNNASRTPEDVARHLRELGLPCAAADVVTSSDAAAWLVGDDLGRGAAVLAVGGPGVGSALDRAGLRPVTPGETTVHVQAVVQGYGPQVTAADLAEAAYAVEQGARWVATNTDGTLPTDRGTAPGNGALVAAVARAVGRDPDVVAGKPEPPLYRLCARRLGVEPSRVLAVGDRLETDIAGAVATGMDSLLVLTGVDDLEAVLEAAAPLRPTHVATDLRALHVPADAPTPGAPAVARLDAAVAAVHAAVDDGAPTARIDELRRVAREVLGTPAHR